MGRPVRTRDSLLRSAARVAMVELLDGLEEAGDAHAPEQIHAALTGLLLRLVLRLHAEDAAFEPGPLRALHARLLDPRSGPRTRWKGRGPRRDAETFIGTGSAAAELLGLLSETDTKAPELVDALPKAPWLAALPDVSVERALTALLAPAGAGASAFRYAEVAPEDLGALHAGLLDVEVHASSEGLRLRPGPARKRAGAHYTPRALTEPVVRDTLAPLLARLGPEPRPEAILALRVCDPAMGAGAFLVEAGRQLAEALRAAWRVHGRPAGVEDTTQAAMRAVATRCLYGVDRDPAAVALARLAIRRACEGPDRAADGCKGPRQQRTPGSTTPTGGAPAALTNALRHGDALVGCSPAQIAAFDWREVPTAAAAGPDAPVEPQTGDLLVAAFFGAADGRERTPLRRALRARLEEARAGSPEAHREIEARVAALRDGTTLRTGARGPVRSANGSPPRGAGPAAGIAPLHWELAFPEVFAAGGFHAVVGNPPFAGKNTRARLDAPAYGDWMARQYAGAHGNADLCAWFVWRAWTLLRPGGGFGLITTNTIAQGDTRLAGLGRVVAAGGRIHAARRRIRWPGEAAVVVSVVHVSRDRPDDPCVLDGARVPRISALLLPDGPDTDPARLPANEGLAFQGPIFPRHQQVDGDDVDGPTVPRSALTDLPDAERRVVRPYLGGDEVLTDPERQPRRWVIDLEGLTEAEARARAPRAFAAVAAAFGRGGLGGRSTGGGRSAESRRRSAAFWRPSSRALGARTILDGGQRFLMHPFTATYLTFVFVDAGTVVGGPHTVFAIHDGAGFAVLQSRVHEVWAERFGSTLGDGRRYTPTDCLATFPMPDHAADAKQGGRTYARLRAAGDAYEAHRDALARALGLGLTALYHRFHDPDEQDPGVRELRALRARMDAAVLAAYGWDDLPTETVFALDHGEADEPAAADARARRPWRCRWTDAVRDEVLARLQARNTELAAR